jgi:hypothetical protein
MPWHSHRSSRQRTVLLCGLLLAVPGCGPSSHSPTRPSPWAEIRVIDATTRRGVPLAELETVNGIYFVTDNAGRVAFQEPGLMNREVFFTVHSHGYEMKKDGFGFRGVRIIPRAGQVSEIKLTRRNIAERLCRLTGEGLYRDTLLLGYEPPLSPSPHSGDVVGQDSVQAALHRNKVYWFWGDTMRIDYPLGLYRTAGATTPVPDPNNPASDPAPGIAFDYFVDPKTGFARAMMPLPERAKGVIWVDGVVTVPDRKGVERLVCHYTRRKSLAKELEQGIAVFDDDKAQFVPGKQLLLAETWRHPRGHALKYKDGGTTWILFGSPAPNVRVPARFEDVLNPTKYEAFTCAKADTGRKPDVGPNGKPVWRWQNVLPPTDAKMEYDWVKRGALKAACARFVPVNAAAPSERILIQSGTVRWNAYRKRWLLIAGQIGGKPSFLGEVWYAESNHPTGPFTKAVKIVTHDHQSFYNVCQHDFLDRAGGRLIYFEGTYTNEFSGNPEKTPRYNYNQILYRLDLSADSLRPAYID